MTFRVVHQPSTNQARCPYRVIVRETGREIDWILREARPARDGREAEKRRRHRERGMGVAVAC